MHGIDDVMCSSHTGMRSVLRWFFKELCYLEMIGRERERTELMNKRGRVGVFIQERGVQMEYRQEVQSTNRK